MSPPAKLPLRKLGRLGPEIPAIGFGLMGISVAYGSVGTDEERLKVLDRAWELGCTNWDTADAYGDSEDLIGKWFKLHPERRQDIFLSSKFGLRIMDGNFVTDSSPEYAKQAVESSLRRLGVDSIDMYYIHRLDGKTPVEKPIQAMEVPTSREGKIKHLGISECSSDSLRRAYAVHPIAAVQVEYNPWSVEIEGEEGTNLMATCRELGVAVFCYSPLGRGIMTGKYKSLDDFEPDDFRRTSPRFQGDNFAKNLRIVEEFQEVAAQKGCSASQLTLAWLMAQGEHVFPIPGTKNIKYLEENVGAAKVVLTDEEEKLIRKKVVEADVAGGRGATFGAYVDTPPL